MHGHQKSKDQPCLGLRPYLDPKPQPEEAKQGEKKKEFGLTSARSCSSLPLMSFPPLLVPLLCGCRERRFRVEEL